MTMQFGKFISFRTHFQSALLPMSLTNLDMREQKQSYIRLNYWKKKVHFCCNKSTLESSNQVMKYEFKMYYLLCL